MGLCFSILTHCAARLIRLIQAKVLLATNVLTPKSIISKMIHLKRKKKEEDDDKTQPSRA